MFLSLDETVGLVKLMKN